MALQVELKLLEPFARAVSRNVYQALAVNTGGVGIACSTKQIGLLEDVLAPNGSVEILCSVVWMRHRPQKKAPLQFGYARRSQHIRHIGPQKPPVFADPS